MQVAAIRITLAALVLAPFVLHQLKKLQRKDFLPILVIGWIGSMIPAFLFALAQTQVSSALSGILNTLVPLNTFILGVLFFGLAFKWNKLIGVLVGLAGALFLILYGANFEASNLYYALLILLAGLCYATSVNTVKRYCQNIPSLLLTTIAFSSALPATIPLLLTSDFSEKLLYVDGGVQAFIYLAILAILGTAFANVIFFKLTQRTNALFASNVTYLIPLVAVFWGWLDGEVIGVYHIVGLLLILFGVYLASK